MTRYARKGAGNPKVPLEASSWDEMQKQKNDKNQCNRNNTQEKVKHKQKEKRKSDNSKKKEFKKFSVLNQYSSELEQFKSKEEKEKFLSVVQKAQRSEDRRQKRIEKRADEKVCYNCRKPGHRISDCPEVKQDVDQGTGICFKCGSTEHISIQCRLKLPPGEFPYAKCFICGETGHLSSSCQDNPRGLYPNGGCCNMCGSVEHYKRDCPEHLSKQGVSSATLHVLDNTQSADAELSLCKVKPVIKKKTGPKTVKF